MRYLSPAASSVSWYWSCLVCSGLVYAIYSRSGPSMYVYWVVCYRVIVDPYVRSVGHVFAYLYTLDDDSECPMYYETSLLPKGFPSYVPTFDMLYLSQTNTNLILIKWHVWTGHFLADIHNSLTATLREESSQTNVILQYKLLATILSAVCSVIQQS